MRKSGQTFLFLTVRFFAALATALRQHWPYYLSEATGLASFILGASFLTLVIEHPASPVHEWLVAQGADKFWRRVPLGLGMGLVIAGLVYHPWGQRSGRTSTRP